MLFSTINQTIYYSTEINSCVILKSVICCRKGDFKLKELFFRVYIFFVTLLISGGLFTFPVSASEPAGPARPLQEEVCCLTASQLAEEENLLAILWVERSAEFRGLCYQAYNLAAMEVGRALAERRNNTGKQQLLHPPAIVIDIDDTIVSHAPFEAYCIEHPEAKKDFGTWEQWISQNRLLLPGAREFLRYAAACPVEIFYVTGRGPQDKEATLQFLHRTDLPFPDETHLLMNDRSGSKMKHFAKLSRRYDIICYIGDNAGDFPIDARREENPVIYKIPKNSDVSSETGLSTDVKIKNNMPIDIQAMVKHDTNKFRNSRTDLHKKSFGTRFILIPNPMYGDWEYNLAKKYRQLPPEQRIALRKAVLKSFKQKR